MQNMNLLNKPACKTNFLLPGVPEKVSLGTDISLNALECDPTLACGDCSLTVFMKHFYKTKKRVML